VLLDAGATRAPSFNRWNGAGHDDVELSALPSIRVRVSPNMGDCTR
jgi:hypothetical protein